MSLVPLSIRLEKGTIAGFKMIAARRGVKYQELMRDALLSAIASEKENERWRKASREMHDRRPKKKKAKR